MEDNNNNILGNGSRVRVIDPNNFDSLYGGGVFGLKPMGMSVSTEDLCIIVELKTKTKNRTILNTDEKTNSKFEVNGDVISFIDGTKNATTANQNYLTTQYTELGTEVESLGESLGITSIDIDFNSSYAPMVNINFVDVKGAAIFQAGGESKYSVLFRLPYPLFELKVKGFYGKPVTYCLHLIKCNTKFNSQTGNFEIAAQFVGYTYAMLSDMIIGYLKAAVQMPEGKKLLSTKKLKGKNGEEKPMISINDFIGEMSNIDKLVEEQLNEDNQNTNNLAIIKELQQMIVQMRLGVKDTLNTLGINYPPEQQPTERYPYITILKDPSDGVISYFKDKKNVNVTIPNFFKSYTELVNKFNEKAGDNEELKLRNDLKPIDIVVNIEKMYNNDTTFKENVKELYKVNLDVDEPTVFDSIVKRLKGAAENLSITNRNVKFYDFTDIANELDDMERTLSKKDEEVSRLVAEDLRDSLASKLGFDPTIRNVIMMLTSHVEVFLELLYQVSAEFKKDSRVKELEIFKLKNDKSRSIDVDDDVKETGFIYPWPEYIENGVEKYLGSKKGPLTNPLNVPEVEFVEKFYEAMVAVSEQEKEISTEGVKAWYSISPIDSVYYNEKKPYDRLDDSAKPEDIVRLMMLRGVGFLGFSNSLLTPEEIQAFATSEANLVLSKFESKLSILQAIKNFTLDKFTDVTGTINGASARVVTLNGNNYEYSYINDKISFILTSNNVVIDRFILPVDKGFNNVSYSINDESAAGYKLTTYSCSNYYGTNTAQYIDFIESNKYDGKKVTSPATNPPSSFSFNDLKTDKDVKYNVDNIQSVGFLANNGKFGVQEYKLINYPSEYGVNGDIDFFSLFYADDNAANSEGWYLPAICGGRKKDTPLDLDNRVFELQVFTENDYNYGDFVIALYKNYDAGKNILTFNSKSAQNQLTYPFLQFGCDNTSYFTQLDFIRMAHDNYFNRVDLFTSRFYNAQNLTSRAFLFLHCFPWRGIYSKKGESAGIFKQTEILNVFRYRTGFVQVPKLWPAFIGGLLWRYREGEKGTDPVIFKIENEFLLPRITDGKIPPHTSYLKYVHSTLPMAFNGRYNKDEYLKIEDEILKLPYVVKEQFITEFLNFANNEFATLKKSFEVLPKNAASDYDTLPAKDRDLAWKNTWNLVYSSGNNILGTNSYANVDSLLKTANNTQLIDRYKVFTYWYKYRSNSGLSDFDYNYITEFKQNGDADNQLKALFFSHKYIANNSITMWGQNNTTLSSVSCSIKPIITKENLTIYINKFKEILATSVEEKEKTFFSNNDNEQIKLEIYRTLKKIYDKWIADTSQGGGSNISNDIIFQCCKSKVNDGRLSTDNALRTKRGANDFGLIDTFRFVTRAFKDIGDIFQINPTMVSRILLTSGNNTFYDVVGRILNDNNFEFIALPNFVDYNNPDRLKEIFTPYSYYEAINETTTGPSFVCVYIGQTSTKLDFGKNSLYPDDGFNFTEVDQNGRMIDNPQKPSDFSEEPKDWEDRGAAFVVKYGHQNQNIFKDISIDQAEFNETAESINITDAIANRFSQASQTYVGQNLYNIYSIRSYKVEIEMMGNAMIQPMMYFQLDNIPMFRGAYLITRVRHSIKPNYMSTHFTGTRINRNQTPLIDVSTLYSAMLDGYSLPKSKPNTAINNITGGKVPPIVLTIQENGGANGNIEQGKITRKEIEVPKGIAIVGVTQENRKILTEAVEPLRVMLTEWVEWMNSQGFKSDNGNYAYIISAYRTVQDQQRERNKAIANGKPKNSTAEPGTSRHGWGIAIDLQYFDKEGNVISNYDSKRNINDKIGFDVNKNPAIKWLYENSYRFGWIIPPELRDTIGIEEFWHWEYHGTAAKCILQNNTNIRGYDVKVDKNYHPSVTNPKKPDGTVAVYTNCDYVSLKQADGGSVASSNSENSILWTYLLWQQGLSGAIEHYKVAKGLMPRYTISVNNIIKNWPSGAISDDGVKASDIRTLYNSNPKKLANAFINVWDKTVAKKSQEALSLIESSKKNRTQKQYLAFKDIFKKYEKPNDGINWTDLATMGFIENSLCTDTDPNDTVQGMFHMNKTYPEYSSVLQNAKKGPSGYKNYVDYDLEKILECAVPIFVKNLKSFSKDTGYTP